MAKKPIFNKPSNRKSLQLSSGNTLNVDIPACAGFDEFCQGTLDLDVGDDKEAREQLDVKYANGPETKC